MNIKKVIGYKRHGRSKDSAEMFNIYVEFAIIATIVFLSYCFHQWVYSV